MKWYIQLVQVLACENEDVVESILKDEKNRNSTDLFEGIEKFASAYYQKFQELYVFVQPNYTKDFCGKN